MRYLLPLLLTLLIIFAPLSICGNIKTQESATLSPAPLTQLSIHRDPDNPLTGGQDYFYDGSTTSFVAGPNAVNNHGVYDDIAVQVGNFEWVLFFSAKADRPIVPGFYDRAKEFGGWIDNPGIRILGSSFNCFPTYGKFVVLDAKLDTSTQPPTVTSFAAQFVQYCGTALRGKVYYHYIPTCAITLNQASVLGGDTIQGKVTLANPAPSGGATVSLSSGNPALATVPASVHVPGGATTAFFTVTTHSVRVTQSVTLLAIHNGVGNVADLDIRTLGQPVTKLHVFGDPEDPITDHKQYTYTPQDGQFGVVTGDDTSDGLIDRISFHFSGNPTGDPIHGPDFWSLDFTTAGLGSNLVPGLYQDAQRATFAQLGHPGLDVSGNGRGCNTLTGSFKILEADFDYSFQPARPLSFAVEFEQHCGGNPPATKGFIYYNYNITPFDMCIQDESSGNLLQINTTTADYQFTNCGGVTIGGTGTLTKRGTQITLQHNASDRRITARIDTATRSATASVQLLSQGRMFSITDRNISNNTCGCK